MALAAACLACGFVLGQGALSMTIRNAFSKVDWPKWTAGRSSDDARLNNVQNSSWRMHLDKVLKMSDQAPDLDALNKLQAAVDSDAAVRMELIQHYAAGADPKARYLYIQLLGGHPSQDVVDFSSTLVNSGDISRRKDGFKLLTDFPANINTYSLVKGALDKEKDPELLRYAVAALHPVVIDPAETQSMVSRLSDLTGHPDLQVRAQSLQMLVQWDKVGSTAEEKTYQAISDDNQEVRQAAIAAIVNSHVRSERLKAKLVKIVSNTNELIDLRGDALRALEDFALNTTEYAIYDQARIEVEKQYQR